MRTMNPQSSKVPSKRRYPSTTVSEMPPAHAQRHRECAVCMEKFKSPRILPCFHTFCLRCLVGLAENHQRTTSFPCPTCRTKIVIPPGGVIKFQVNFYIEAEVDAVSPTSEQLVCATGCTMAATHKCFECSQLMCDHCKRVHETIPVTKSHTVVSLNSSATNAHVIKRDRFCDKHPQEIIRFFCQTCKAILCRDCKLTSHERHPSCDLSLMTSNGKQFLSDIRKRFKEYLEPKLKEELSSAKDHQNNLIKKVEELRQELTNKAEDIKKAIDVSLNQTLEKLEKDGKDVKSEVDTAIEEMQQQMAFCQSLFEHAECVAENGVDADVLDLPSKLEAFFGMTTYGGFKVLSQERHKLTAFTDGKWRRSVEWIQPNNGAGADDQVKDYVGKVRIINVQHTEEGMHEQWSSGQLHTKGIAYIILMLQNYIANWEHASTGAVHHNFPFYRL